ncbi:hypothetical protein [Georgenia alba]|uniref:Uncharacterized protein n=1 Tax=Georgenia alba TaxID=2233858 RepID=A0ABW2Q8V0_9MICO
MSETTTPSGSDPGSASGSKRFGRRSEDATSSSAATSRPATAGSSTTSSGTTSPGTTGSGTTGSGTTGSGTAGTKRGTGSGVPKPGAPKGNPVAWTALLVAVVLTIWQAVYSLTVLGIDPPDQETFTSVSLFITLVLGLAALVLGIVSIAQRRAPRWPGLVGLSVGIYAFIVAVFSWIGGLMNQGGA